MSDISTSELNHRRQHTDGRPVYWIDVRMHCLRMDWHIRTWCRPVCMTSTDEWPAPRTNTRTDGGIMKSTISNNKTEPKLHVMKLKVGRTNVTDFESKLQNLYSHILVDGGWQFKILPRKYGMWIDFAIVVVVNRLKITLKLWSMKKPTAPGIPRRSPIQVLTGLDVA